MQIGGVLGVESIGCRSCAQADRHYFAANQVQTSEALGGIGWTEAVDALPNSLYRSAVNKHLQVATAHRGENLSGCGDAVLSLEDICKFRMHAAMLT